MTEQIEMDFSVSKKFRYSVMDYRLAAIYRLSLMRGFKRPKIASLLVKRAGFKGDAADRLVGHWLTSWPYRQQKVTKR